MYIKILVYLVIMITDCRTNLWRYLGTILMIQFDDFSHHVCYIVIAAKKRADKMPFHIHVQNHIHYNLYFSDPFSFFFKAWWHKIWYFVKNKNWWWQPFYLGSVLPIILHYTFSLYMTFKATYNTCVKLLSHLHVSQLGEFQHSSCPFSSRLAQCFACIVCIKYFIYFHSNHVS